MIQSTENNRLWWEAVDKNWKRILKVRVLPLHSQTRGPVAVTKDLLKATSDEEIAEIVGMRILDLKYDFVNQVRPLFYLNQMERLNLYKQKVSDVRPLRFLQKLTVLNLGKNPLTDIGPLRSLESLRSLSLRGTGVTDLRPLINLPNLQHLFLSRSPVTHLKPLAHIKSLKVVDCFSTDVGEQEIKELFEANPSCAVVTHKLA